MEKKLFLWVKLLSFPCSVKKRSMQNLKISRALPKRDPVCSLKIRENDSQAFLIQDCSK